MAHAKRSHHPRVTHPKAVRHSARGRALVAHHKEKHHAAHHAGGHHHKKK